jgi:hypothetical protein
VPNDTLLGALAATSPDVNTKDITALAGLSSRDDLSVGWVRGGEIGDPLLVVGERVVCVEPGCIGSRCSLS